MAPETGRSRGRRKIDKPGTRLLLGEKPEALQEMGLPGTGFTMQDEPPGLISLIDGFNGILNALECSPINIRHVPEGFIPGRIHPILKKWIGNIR